ncbi:MAG TPA: CoA transferase [Acidimicrobiales bacterium]|nr:CoA transferase [Acidimicrobiales bacterium]
MTVAHTGTDSKAAPPRPLGGVRVVDLTGAIGAYCTRILADLGADVVKVEPPAGDPMRSRPPFKRGVMGPEASLVFAAYHANKRGVTLDAGVDAALPLLSELAATADVVVVSPTRKAPLAGFDWDEPSLSWVPGGAVVVALTPFGLSGPFRELRSTPFVSFAFGGGMHHIGRPDGPPVAVPGQQLWDYAGLAGAIGALAALHARPRVGGQVLDVSVHEAATAMDFLIERYDAEGAGRRNRGAGIGYPPTGTWWCEDGALEVSCHQQHHWQAFLHMLDDPDELSEPSLNDPLVRREAFEGLREVIARLMASRKVLDLFERGQAAGLPCNPLYSVAQFVRDPQARSRGLFVEMTKAGLGTVELPWKSFSSTPRLLELRRPAPSLGEHNVEVFVDELGHTRDELERWRATGLV